jgi:hypothetical protein
MRPAIDDVASRRARLTRRQFWGTVVRTIGYIATALICAALVHRVDHAWSFAIRVGLVISLVTGVLTTVNPLHRVLRRQPSGATARSLRHRTDPYAASLYSPYSMAGTV